MKYIRRSLGLTVLVAAFGLSAVAADQAPVARKQAAPTGEAKAPVKAPVKVRPRAEQDLAEQPGQVVFQVLLAEIALQRGDPQLASDAYASLALRTRDPKVFERAIEVAGYAHRYDLALETARLWVDVEPGSKKAQQALASVMILSNQLDDLAPNLVRMLESDRASLPENLMGLNRMLARNPDRLAVFHLIEQVCRPFFGLPEAHYAVAMAAAGAGVNERALAEVRRALELRPDWEMAALLQVQILLRNSPAEAIDFMQAFVEKNPKARDVHLLLARALVGEKRYADARQHFDQLLKTYPDSPEIVYPAAVLALQQNDRVQAESELKHFVSLPAADKSFAYYYLGQIAEDDKRIDEALAHYARVGAGERYLPAQLRRAQLLTEQGKLDAGRKILHDAKGTTTSERVQLIIADAALLREAKQPQAAFDVLEKALAAQPDQPDLLYETALLAERLDRLDILELRLRKLIELRPDSAQAYNALGYSYADRNLHLDEARQLIEKALALSPDDSFILDSMGWVLYRQGELPAALDYLERAFARRADPEIAAHMGEVLWALGRQDEARRTLQDALQKSPDNEALAAAVRKIAH